MADVTYIIIEGDTETDEDIKSFMDRIRDTLETQFAPRKVTIAIQDYLPIMDDEILSQAGEKRYPQ